MGGQMAKGGVVNVKTLLTLLMITLTPVVAGYGQWTGKVEGNLHALPAPGLDKLEITLTYTIGAFEMSSFSKFDSGGFDTQTFKLEGTLGSLGLTGEIKFDPSGPEYKSAWVEAKTQLDDLRLSLKVKHELKEGGPYILYTFKVDSRYNSEWHYHFTAHMEDDCTGIAFKDLTLELEDLSLCCGITYDVELSLTKEGFDYIEFTAEDLFSLCCGISFDVSAKFTTTTKELSIKPKWEGLKNCITVYGDLKWNKEENRLEGLEIQGVKVRCEFNECSFAEFKTAFTPGTLGFREDEFEYIKLCFCGPSCCGDEYKATFTFYFDGAGTLLGLSRFTAETEVPLMSNLTLTSSLEVGTSGGVNLDVGWKYSF